MANTIAASRSPSEVLARSATTSTGTSRIRTSVSRLGTLSGNIAANASDRHHPTVHAIVLEQPGRPLEEAELPDPRPEPGQLLLKVTACAVCRTDLHLRDQEIAATKLPVVLG